MLIGKASPIATSVGQLGADFINDIAAHEGSWGVIYCITTCSFTVLTAGNRLSPTGVDTGVPMMSGTLNGITMLPGMSIYGYFTAITLASGSVVAYVV